MYIGPTYMGLTCIGHTPYVSWCRVDVNQSDVEITHPIFLHMSPIFPMVDFLKKIVGVCTRVV
jgi:hypothetical protein